jgi:trehalose/maltose transport system permease protein
MGVAATSQKSLTPRRRETTLSGRQMRLALLLLLPTFIVLVLVAFYPLARTFLASFTDELFARPDQKINYVGLDNYQKLLSVQIVEVPEGKTLRSVLPEYLKVADFELFGHKLTLAARDPDFIESINNTLIFTVFSVALELLIGLIIALVVNTHFRGRGAMRAAMLIPWAIPTAISTVLWRGMLADNSSGAINALMLSLKLIPESQAWRSQYPLLSVVAVDVWKTAPFMALLLLAGLQTISGDLYEAAAVDGATTWQRFIHLTLPLLRPTILIALVFRTLDALRVFDLFQILLGRSTPSMAVYNQEKLISSYLYGYASATGVLIFILIFAFTVLYMSAFRVQED